MSIFKYHPDGVIFIKGLNPISFDEFIIVQPDFPIEKGKFFSLDENDLFTVIQNVNGSGYVDIPIDIASLQVTIDKIKDLLVDLPDKMAFHYTEKLAQEKATIEAEELRLDIVRATHGNEEAKARLLEKQITY